jgi:hypothetical protein
MHPQLRKVLGHNMTLVSAPRRYNNYPHTIPEILFSLATRIILLGPNLATLSAIGIFE